MVNSGEFGTRNDGATPISNRRATSDDVPNFSSIDYNIINDTKSPKLQESINQEVVIGKKQAD
ncbi:MAG: palindromic element RPE2 domain-containing protein [Candidatus Tisiphia sp.]|nr:palindromic element RPE2 domain-containing protein [Candidatus Tisiphia sp.]